VVEVVFAIVVVVDAAADEEPDPADAPVCAAVVGVTTPGDVDDWPALVDGVVVEVVTVGVEAPPDATVVGALAATVVVVDVVAGAAVVVVAGATGVQTA
jgi:hypothetical protein